MFKKLVVFSLAALSPLLAQASTYPENPQMGRYQVVSAVPKEGQIQLYLLDTATGQIWKSTAKYNWLGQHDAWESQISSLKGQH